MLGTALPVQAATVPPQAASQAAAQAAGGASAPAATAAPAAKAATPAAPAPASPASPASPAKANPAPAAGGKSAPAASTAPASSKGNGGGAGKDTTAAKGSGGTSAGNGNAGCKQTPYGSSGNSANNGGLYDDTCDGSASGNGNGGGEATGKPCAGCVGKADEKNPGGQNPNTPKAGSDGNNGYECDGNKGIARTNPAHTGCKDPTPPPCVPTEQDPCEPPAPCIPTAEDPCEPPAPVCPASDPDCTEVRGVTFRRTPPPGTRVLGDTVTERPRAGTLAVAGLTLPVTGGTVLDIMLLGTALLLAGSALSRLAARRRQGGAARH